MRRSPETAVLLDFVQMRGAGHVFKSWIFEERGSLILPNANHLTCFFRLYIFYSIILSINGIFNPKLTYKS